MNILFITFSDITVCSSSNIRNVSLIKGLLDLGHTVDIISYKIANKAVLIDESFAPIISKCRIIEITASLSTEKVSSTLLSSHNKSIKRILYNKLRKIFVIDRFAKQTVSHMTNREIGWFFLPEFGRQPKRKRGTKDVYSVYRRSEKTGQ